MVNLDGSASSLTTQEKSSLPAHVQRAADFALQRELPLVALCGAGCNHQAHGRKGHASTARGKVPIRQGWSASPIRRLADIPLESGNIGIVTGLEVCALDIDDEAGLAWAQANMPVTPWRTLTGAGVRQHWFYRPVPGEIAGMVLSLGDGKAMHVRGENALVVAPYSIHWTGRIYEPVGDWSAPLSSLPLFNRQTAETIRGLRGDKRREVALLGKAAAISDGRLPPSGQWTDEEVEALLDDAWERITDPRNRSESFRRARFTKYLGTRTPCIAGAAEAQAMEILRKGLCHLLLPADAVLDLAVASDWATKATESDGKTPWPWQRSQLAALVRKTLRKSWRSSFGEWVSAPAPRSTQPPASAPSSGELVLDPSATSPAVRP